MTLFTRLAGWPAALSIGCAALLQAPAAIAQKSSETTTKFQKMTLIPFADLRQKYGWDGEMATRTCGGPGIMQIQKDGTKVFFGNWCVGNLRFKGAVGVIVGRGLNFDTGTTLTFPKVRGTKE